MKKFNLVIIMVIIMTLFTSSSVFANSTASKITVTVNNKTVKYDVKPYIKDGEVMLPVKQTAEALGAKVVYDSKSKAVWVNLGMMHVEIPVGKSEFYIHRDADFSGIPQTVKINAPIKRVKNRVFIPGEIFVESLGMEVTWDSDKKVFSITNNSSIDSDLTKAVRYTELTQEDISGISDVYKWYNENNQKLGINYIKDGKYMYILIGGGERPTGGYTISIDNICYSAKDVVTINAKVSPPGDNVRVMMVITYPSMLIRIASDSIKTVNGEVVDVKTTDKEKWITMDSSTVTMMELVDLNQLKIRDITGTERDAIMKSFNEATLDPNFYIEMITGSILKVTINDGTIVSFTSYGSDTNVIASFVKDGETRTFHLVAPVIAKTLLNK